MPLTSFASCPSASPQPVSPLPTTNGADENCENCKKNVTKEPPVIIVDDSQQKVIDSQQKEIDSQQKAIDDLKRQIEQYKTNEKQMNRYYNTSDKFLGLPGTMVVTLVVTSGFGSAEFFSLVESGFEQLLSSLRNRVLGYPLESLHSLSLIRWKSSLEKAQLIT